MKQKEVLALYDLHCMNCEDIGDRTADYIYDLELRFDSRFHNVMHSINDAEKDIKMFIKQSKFFIKYLTNKKKKRYCRSMLKEVQYHYKVFKLKKSKIKKDFKIK